jgi:hypothetical protein
VSVALLTVRGGTNVNEGLEVEVEEHVNRHPSEVSKLLLLAL